MNRISRASLIGVVTIALSGGMTGIALAQNPHAAPPPAAKVQPKEQPAVPGAEHRHDVKPAQQTLDELVAAMNAATGCEKMSKMAAVMTELAARLGRTEEHMNCMMSHEMPKMDHGPAAAPSAREERNPHAQQPDEY